MGGSKKKAPPAPDYKALAQQQAQLQNQALQQQTVANRPNQQTAFGNISWTQDPATGQWTQKETLSPELQAQYDRSLALQGQQLTQLEQLINRGAFQGPAVTAQYNQGYADKYANDMLTTLTSRMRPQYEQDQSSMATKLRLQGLQPGTEAYDRAYRNLLTSQGDVLEQANLQAQLAGQGEARNQFQTELGSQQAAYDRAWQEYILPFQTYSALQGNTNSLYKPTFQGFTGSGMAATPDILGSAQQQYAQQMQQYNEAQQKKSSKGSSIGTIVGGVGGFMVGGPAGAAIGASAGGQLGSSFSDPALKEDIEVIPDELCYEIMLKLLPISFTWTGTSVRDAGLNAEQVLELAPELCERGAKGLLKVNYSKFNAYLLGAFRHLAKLEASHERR